MTANSREKDAIARGTADDGDGICEPRFVNASRYPDTTNPEEPSTDPSERVSGFPAHARRPRRGATPCAPRLGSERVSFVG